MVEPTRDDRVLTALSDGIGGPVGDRARRAVWWTPVRVVLAFTALWFALGMVQKAPCYEDNWTDDQGRFVNMCYSDLPYLYVGRGFVEGVWPYSDDEEVRAKYDVMEYPVGISYFAYAAAGLTHRVSGAEDIDSRAGVSDIDLAANDQVMRERRVYVAVTAVLLGLCALVAAWCL